MDPNINRILTFWFSQPNQPKGWFQPSSALDNQIRTDFGPLVQQARTPALDSWVDKSPQGTLALLILLDQFTRNIFRGSADSYSSDKKALDIAVKGIAKGYDREVLPMQQGFFYLPLMHSEQLLSQIAAVSLCEGLVQRCGFDEKAEGFAVGEVNLARKHRDVIAAFGRFPSRNEVLGREETVEEREFLREHPSGW